METPSSLNLILTLNLAKNRPQVRPSKALLILNLNWSATPSLVLSTTRLRKAKEWLRGHHPDHLQEPQLIVKKKKTIRKTRGRWIIRMMTMINQLSRRLHQFRILEKWKSTWDQIIKTKYFNKRLFKNQILLRWAPTSKWISKNRLQAPSSTLKRCQHNLVLLLCKARQNSVKVKRHLRQKLSQ